MRDSLNVGIDIGATKANIGLITNTGKIVDSVRIPVDKNVSAENFILKVSEHVHGLIRTNHLTIKDIYFFGAGVPGTADVRTGIVEYCPNLGWEDVPASKIFMHYLGAEVVMAQDARLAAWAEFLFGAGRNFNSILCITLGTGIGGGIVIDGKIYHGAMNTAGEIGHSVFQKNGRPCNCGNHGCLERYSSGTGIIERALEAFPEKFTHLPHKSESVFDLAYAGDRQIVSLIGDFVEDLAVGIANAVSIISPEVVVISGGLCSHDEFIINPLKDLVYSYGYYSWVRKACLQIVKAQMGSDAPMIGAGLLYKSL